jgi:hypothetical protein
VHVYINGIELPDLAAISYLFSAGISSILIVFLTSAYFCSRLFLAPIVYDF